MVRLKVEKMGCGGCVKSVTRAVQAIEPNASVDVDLGGKLVTVSGAAVRAERIAQVITAAGCPAEPIFAKT